jgi:CHAT domain-containing protein
MHEEMLHLMDAFILEAQGSYTEAESEYRKIKSLGLGPGRVFLEKYPASFISVDMYHARNLLNQQRLMEAEVESRKALMASLAHAGKESALTGQALTLLTRIIQAQGRLEEAERLSDAAIRILEVAGTPADSYLMGLARVTKGDILAATEDYTGAMTQYDLARAGMKENKFLYERSFMQNPMMALSMLMTGRYNEAGSLASQGYNNYQKRFGERHENTAEMLALRGMAQERVNHLREAVQDLSAATDILMQARTEEGEFARHKKLRRVIIDDYIGLLAKIHGTSIEKELGIDAIAVSFKMAEANRSRSVQGALVASGARAAVTDRELAELIRREQDADRQIFTMESSILDLMASPSGQQDSKAIQKLRSDVENLRRARDSFLNETKKRFPRYADFVNPSPSTIPYIQGVLRSGEVLLSLYTTKDQTFVWAIPQQGRILFHAATLGRKDLGKIVQDLRKSLDVNPNTLGDIPDFDTSLAYHLYAELIKPIEMGWKSATELIVVASGPLGQIPLDLLPTDRVNPRVEKDLLFSRYRSIPWLIRKVSVTSVPSVSSLVSLRTVPAGDPKRKAFVGFGDPVFSKAQMAKIPSQLASVDTLIEKGKGTMPLIASRGMKVKVRGIRISEKGNLDKQEITSSQLSQLQRLPDTAEEIRSIAQVLNADMERDVFLGKEATKHRIKTMDLTDRKIIAFATHALVPGDLDGLDEPALALSSPEVTGDKEDGLLTMGEIMKLKLNADWVILSACNSGASNGAGQEAISGLGRAFFYAGTRSLLVTLWPVETTSAKKLVTGIFKAQKTDDTLSRSQALRKSMLHLMDDESFVDETTGKIAASYAHPLFWAPFIIVGDPGGN